MPEKIFLELLEDSNLTNCKPVYTPLDPSIRLSQDEGLPYPNITTYIRLVGKLLYMILTALI